MPGAPPLPDEVSAPLPLALSALLPEPLPVLVPLDAVEAPDPVDDEALLEPLP